VPILSSFDIIFLIGWKYHERQKKAKQKGTAEFSLKNAVSEMNSQEADSVKYGIIIDDGENVTEK